MIYLSKRPFYWAYFQDGLFLEGLIIGGNFVLQKQQKQPKTPTELKTDNPNSPWVAYIKEGLLYYCRAFGERDL